MDHFSVERNAFLREWELDLQSLLLAPTATIARVKNIFLRSTK